MKTSVKNLDKGTYGMTANLKKLLVQILEMNNPKCFNAKFTANRTKMMIEPQGDNKYKVTQYSTYRHNPDLVYNVEVVTK